MSNRFFFVFCAAVTVFCASAMVRAKAGSPVAKPAGTKARPAIGGGTVNLPCNITPKSITINDDGSVAIAIDREIGGGHRLRQNIVSPDGLIFLLDGVQVASPPPAMLALGGVVSQLQSRFAAAYSAPGVAALICAP
jgi:hypothetical protein